MQNKPLMKRLSHLSFGLTLLILLGFSNQSYGSHAAAADLGYRCQGDTAIEVTLILYRDCTGIAAPTAAAFNLTFFDSCRTEYMPDTSQPSWVRDTTYYVPPINVSIAASTALEDSCSTVINTCDDPCYRPNCVCGAGNLPTNPQGPNDSCTMVGQFIYPSVERYIYKFVIVLPGMTNNFPNPRNNMNGIDDCGSLRISYSLSARNPSTNVSGGNLYLETIIDLGSGICNSTPNYRTDPPISYACQGQPFSYSFAGLDTPDNHILTYSMKAPGTGIGSFVNFTPPMSVNQPFLYDAPDSMYLDSLTGQLTFTPQLGVVQNGVMAVNVWEFDKFKNLIGVSTRELYIFVLPPDQCTNSPYDSLNFTNIVNTNAVPNKVRTFAYCIGDTISFDFDIGDPDTFQNLTVTNNATAVLGDQATLICDTAFDNPIPCKFYWIVPNTVDTGLQTINVIVKDDGCPIPATQVLSISFEPYAAYTCPPKTFCVGDPEAQVEAFGGEMNYNWRKTEAFVDPTVANPIFKRDWTEVINSGWYLVDITNPCGTTLDSVEVTFEYTIFPDIKAWANQSSITDTFIFENASLQLDGKTRDAASYLWFPNVNISCFDCFDPVYSSDTRINTTYILKVETDEGCRNFDTLVMEVKPFFVDIFAPNAFTPNQDLINDVFIINTFGLTSLDEVVIFNRWGQELYKEENRAIELNTRQDIWDGEFNGTQQTVGSYVYYIRATDRVGSPFFKKGDFTILK